MIEEISTFNTLRFKLMRAVSSAVEKYLPFPIPVIDRICYLLCDLRLTYPAILGGKVWLVCSILYKTSITAYLAVKRALHAMF